MVGGEALRTAAGLEVHVSRLGGRAAGLLMGQQPGYGLDSLIRVLATTELAGECPPVLQMGDAVLEPNTS
nr:hypothetical protein [Streptomyces sp. B15]